MKFYFSEHFLKSFKTGESNWFYWNKMYFKIVSIGKISGTQFNEPVYECECESIEDPTQIHGYEQLKLF